MKNGGDEEDRTPDLLNANQALSQLSYVPVRKILTQFIFSYALRSSKSEAWASQNSKHVPLR